MSVLAERVFRFNLGPDYFFSPKVSSFVTSLDEAEVSILVACMFSMLSEICAVLFLINCLKLVGHDKNYLD